MITPSMHDTVLIRCYGTTGEVIGLGEYADGRRTSLVRHQVPCGLTVECWYDNDQLAPVPATTIPTQMEVQ